ncbi:hypothetical protein RDWZM_000394 [Blomia tropicalis]|uniref:Uncharacterized protein n=1 Tax=Blomia tropicalis TaxID=40697 RepID=A0A9Q0MA96_BLOTA|nr:hypothetical protein RDWZM_000394 [Blomia tropicalis]
MNFIQEQFDNSRVRRCIYQTTKQMVYDHGTRKARIWHIIDTFAFIYGAVRCLTAALIIKYKFKIDPRIPYNIKRDDALLTYFQQQANRYREDIPLMMAAYVVFNYIMQRAIYRLNVDKMVWHWWYQLIVVNLDNYDEFYIENFQKIKHEKTIECYRMLQHYRLASFIPNFWVNLYIRFMAEYTIHIKLNQLEDKSFFQKRLSILPNMSNELRTLVINTLVICDNVSLFLQAGGVASTLSVYAFVVSIVDLRELAWYGYIWHFMELAICIYIATCIYQSALFFSVYTIIGAMSFAGHVIQTNRILWKLIIKCRKKSPLCPIVPWNSRSIINYHLNEHIRVTYLVITGGDYLFGHILYSFLLINIPINVYMIRRIFFEEHDFIDQLMSWAISIVQVLLSVVAFGPLAWCNEVYHSPAKFIPSVQPMLRGHNGWLWFQMKYDELYHRLVDDGPQLAINVGPLHPITYMTSFEVYENLHLFNLFN